MVKLKNIKIDDFIAICDIYPEDSTEKGYIKADLNNKEITEYSLPNGYEYCENHLYKAMDYLSKHANEIKTIPIYEKTIMWY